MNRNKILLLALIIGTILGFLQSNISVTKTDYIMVFDKGTTNGVTCMSLEPVCGYCPETEKNGDCYDFQDVTYTGFPLRISGFDEQPGSKALANKLTFILGVPILFLLVFRITKLKNKK